MDARSIITGCYLSFPRFTAVVVTEMLLAFAISSREWIELESRAAFLWNSDAFMDI
jgi:hypothetical protein